MKKPLRTPMRCMLQLFCLLGALAWACCPASAQEQASAKQGKYVLTPKQASQYRIEPVEGYDTVKVRPDGTFTVRVKVTYYALTVPACFRKDGRVDGERVRSMGIAPDPNAGAGSVRLTEQPTLGAVLQRVSNAQSPDDLGPDQFDIDTGELKDGRDPRNFLFNQARRWIPRADSSIGLRQIAGQEELKKAAVEDLDEDRRVRIKDNDVLFAYGDSLLNARLVRNIAYRGIHSITYEDVPGKNPEKKRNAIQFLRNPADPAAKSPDVEDASEEAAKRDGLWHFDFYDVGDVNGIPMPLMAEVSVDWIVQATIDANDPITEFPILNAQLAQPSTGAEAGSGEGGGNQAGGSVHTPEGIPAFLGVGADVSGLELLKGGATPDVSTGVRFIVGAGTKNDGPGLLYGAQAFRTHQRLGFLLAKTTGSRSAFVFAPTFAFNNNAYGFFGAAVRDASGLTRWSPSWGIAFNLDSFTNKKPPATDDKRVEVAVTPAPMAVTPCLRDQAAALVWTIGPDVQVVRPQDDFDAAYLNSRAYNRSMPRARFSADSGGSRPIVESLLFWKDWPERRSDHANGRAHSWITWLPKSRLEGIDPGKDAGGRSFGGLDALQVADVTDSPGTPAFRPPTTATTFLAGEVYRADFGRPGLPQGRERIAEPTDEPGGEDAPDRSVGPEDRPVGRTRDTREQGSPTSLSNATRARPLPRWSRREIPRSKEPSHEGELPDTIRKRGPAPPKQTGGLRVRGIVRLPEGVRPEEVSVEVEREDGTVVLTSRQVEIGREGDFQFSLPPGAYRIRAAVPGQPAWHRDFDLKGSTDFAIFFDG